MPIVDVELVDDGSLEPELAATLAGGLARVFGGDPERTWVRVRRLDGADYAEGDGGPGPAMRPVFVSILKADVPDKAAIVSEVHAVVEFVAAACGRPRQNVHVLYEPAGRGRIAFGGEVVS